MGLLVLAQRGACGGSGCGCCCNGCARRGSCHTCSRGDVDVDPVVVNDVDVEDVFVEPDDVEIVVAGDVGVDR